MAGPISGRRGGAVLAALTSLALAACGSGASGSRSASAPASPATTTTTTSTTATTTSSTAAGAGRSPRVRIASAASGCVPAHTAVSLGGGRAGLGHDGEVLLFRNAGPVPCSLTGYPGVAFVSTSGRHGRLDVARTPQGYLGGLSSSDRVNPVVRLMPGQTASALLEGEAVNAAGRPCSGYQRLLVTPPNQTVTVTFDRPVNLCAPEIHPVVPGTSGSQSQ